VSFTLHHVQWRKQGNQEYNKCGNGTKIVIDIVGNVHFKLIMLMWWQIGQTDATRP
jgi:hypothetical protein